MENEANWFDDAGFRDWGYEILDKDSDTVLMSDRGFETKEDAELQAKMEAKAENIKNYRIVTFQAE